MNKILLVTLFLFSQTSFAVPSGKKIKRLEEQKQFLEALLKQKNIKKIPNQKSSSKTHIRSLTEKQFYSQFISYYQNGQYSEFVKSYAVFRKVYPKSVLTDRVLYLLSQMDMSLGKYSESLRSVNEILDKYPLSLKRPSSLYTKAQLFHKLNLSNQSANVLKRIAALYPNSVEANMAKHDLKFLNSQKVKK